MIEKGQQNRIQLVTRPGVYQSVPSLVGHSWRQLPQAGPHPGRPGRPWEDVHALWAPIPLQKSFHVQQVQHRARRPILAGPYMAQHQFLSCQSPPQGEDQFGAYWWEGPDPGRPDLPDAPDQLNQQCDGGVPEDGVHLGAVRWQDWQREGMQTLHRMVCPSCPAYEWKLLKRELRTS